MPPEPSFASDATATRTTITQAMMDAGFQIGQTLTAGQLNSYLRYALSSLPPYTDIQTAYESADVGGIVQVYENDTLTKPGLFIDAYRTGASFNVMAATTNVIIAAATSDATFYAYDRNDPDLTAVQTFTKTNTGDIRQIAVFGDYVAAAYGTRIEVWRISTGASVWVYNHGGDTYCVAINGNRVLAGGDAGTGSYNLRLLNLASGAVIGSYDHNAILYGVALYGDLLFACGAPGVSGYDVIAFHTSLSSPLWGLTVGGAAGVNAIVTDGRHVYVAQLGEVSCIPCADAVAPTIVSTFDSGSAALLNYLAVDQGGVIAGFNALGTGSLYRLALQTLSMIWKAPSPPSDLTTVSTDGAKVWVTNDAGVTGLWSFVRGNCPQRFVKRDGSAYEWQRFPWLLVPEVE